MNLPRGQLLFDTSAYIRYIRESGYDRLAEDPDIVERSVFTAVVAAELYAGVRHVDDVKYLDSLCRWHRRFGSFSAPSGDSWVRAGVLLARYARLFGNVRMADHFRDVLIGLEAVDHRATLVTENARDFFRWRKLLRASGRNLKIFDLRKQPAE